MMKKLYAGIDIGGTAIKAGLLNKDGEVLRSSEISTDAKNGAGAVLQNALTLVDAMLDTIGTDRSQIAGVGMGLPGIVDGDVVAESTNLGWRELNIAEEFSKLSDIPLRAVNDADAAALGEARFGAARGRKNVFMLTLGTGLGSGIVLNGELCSGNRGFGGEMGHVSLVSGGRKCVCGRRGCAEMYLSATALVKEAGREVKRYPDSPLNSGKITAKRIFKLSDSDPLCEVLAERFAERLSELCIDIANAFRPEAIILGGGVSLAGKKLTEPVQRAVNERSFAASLAPKVEILSAALGNNAGFMGAASLWI